MIMSGHIIRIAIPVAQVAGPLATQLCRNPHDAVLLGNMFSAETVRFVQHLLGLGFHPSMNGLVSTTFDLHALMSPNLQNFGDAFEVFVDNLARVVNGSATSCNFLVNQDANNALFAFAGVANQAQANEYYLVPANAQNFISMFG